MTEKAYHHGNLQIELIEQGLSMIYEEGIANFSLRKLAKRIGVSPPACYKHYENVEALISAMNEYVTNKFSQALFSAVTESKVETCTILMGVKYVEFFAQHPHYFSFIFDGKNCSVDMNHTDICSEFEPFRIFREYAIKMMESLQVPAEHQLDNLIAMWSTVHGLAAMANMKEFHYDGDWGALTEQILRTRINIF